MKKIKEFDKIYIAKYRDVLTTVQLAKDLGITKDKVENIISELMRSGLYKIYKEMPEEEWEELENKSNEYIIKKYAANAKELLNIFIVQKIKFKNYYSEDYKMKHVDEKKERWKQIRQFHYSLSDYGRVRNDLTGTIKERRFHKGIMQSDIYENGKRYTVSIKRAVAEMYIRELLPGEKVRCIDRDGNNLYYRNLEIYKD